MKAFILAAGVGSRLGSLLQDRPKPMLEFQGKPILEYNLEMCAKAGILDVVMNLHFRPETIQGYFGDGSKWGLSIHYVYESQLLGTSGTLAENKGLLKGAPVVVIYGDNLCNYDLKSLILFHQQKHAEMTIAAYPLDNVSNSGVLEIDTENRVTGFIEKPKQNRTQSNLVNMGVYLIEPALIESIPPGVSDFGRDIIPLWLTQKRKIYAMRMPHKVLAVDTPELLNEANQKGGPI